MSVAAAGDVQFWYSANIICLDEDANLPFLPLTSNWRRMCMCASSRYPRSSY